MNKQFIVKLANSSIFLYSAELNVPSFFRELNNYLQLQRFFEIFFKNTFFTFAFQKKLNLIASPTTNIRVRTNTF